MSATATTAYHVLWLIRYRLIPSTGLTTWPKRRCTCLGHLLKSIPVAGVRFVAELIALIALGLDSALDCISEMNLWMCATSGVRFIYVGAPPLFGKGAQTQHSVRDICVRIHSGEWGWAVVYRSEICRWTSTTYWDVKCLNRCTHVQYALEVSSYDRWGLKSDRCTSASRTALSAALQPSLSIFCSVLSFSSGVTRRMSKQSRHNVRRHVTCRLFAWHTLIRHEIFFLILSHQASPEYVMARYNNSCICM